MEIQYFVIDLAAAGLPSVPGRLATATRPYGGEWLADYLAGYRARGVDTLVSALKPREQRRLDLADEAEAARALGIEFRSLPIPDFGVPPDRAAAIALADELGEQLVAGRFVVCHCRAGIGRSTVLAAAIMIRLGGEPGRVLAAIADARGRKVPETRAQANWLSELSVSSRPPTLD